MGAVLDVRELTMDFGGLRALNRVNLHVEREEIVALVGPNGAGRLPSSTVSRHASSPKRRHFYWSAGRKVRAH